MSQSRRVRASNDGVSNEDVSSDDLAKCAIDRRPFPITNTFLITNTFDVPTSAEETGIPPAQLRRAAVESLVGDYPRGVCA